MRPRSKPATRMLAATRRALAEPPGRLSALFYAAALALWASSWDMRLSVLMAWMPVEPIHVGTFAVLLCAVHRCGQPWRPSPWLVGVLVLLVVGFVPGALRSSAYGAGPAKLEAMVFVLLPVVCAAMILLDSREARRAWVAVQALLGAMVALATVLTSHVSVLEPGRFTLATVDTIATARPVGAAVVVMTLLALSARRRWWLLVPAALSAMVLVQVGSRGPLMFAMLSVLLVLLVGRSLSGRRLALTALALVAGLGVYGYAVLDGGSGGVRLLSMIGSGLYDDSRLRLLETAWHLGQTHLLGVGWGDFAQASTVGAQAANSRGVSYAHNVFGEAFSEGGIPALVVLCLAALIALVRVQRLSSHRVDTVLLATLIYWLLNAQVSSDLVGNRFMWISIACGVAAGFAPASPARAGAAADPSADAEQSVGGEREPVMAV